MEMNNHPVILVNERFLVEVEQVLSSGSMFFPAVESPRSSSTNNSSSVLSHTNLKCGWKVSLKVAWMMTHPEKDNSAREMQAWICDSRGLCGNIMMKAMRHVLCPPLVLVAHHWFLEVDFKNSKSCFFFRSRWEQRCYKKKLEEIAPNINQRGMVEKRNAILSE